jgi:hypothetical protein
MPTELPVRLAIRTDAAGGWTRAYLARPGTMSGALLVATIRASAIADPGARRLWTRALKRGFALAVSDLTGVPTSSVTMLEKEPPADA